MAHNHVPNDQHPPQGQQPLYPEPSSYDHLFPRASQYHNAPPTWDQFGHAPHNAALIQQRHPQSWQLPHQAYDPGGQPYGNPPQGYQAQPLGTFQYSQYGNHGPSNYGHSPVVDPALAQDATATRTQQQSPYNPQTLRTITPQGQPTVSPQSLQQNGLSAQNVRPGVPSSHYQLTQSTTDVFAQRPAPVVLAPQPVTNPKFVIPKGKWVGGFYVIDQAALSKSTYSTPVNTFLNIAQAPVLLSTNKTALPVYNPRLSIKDMKKTGAGNKKLLEKHVQKHKPSATKLLLAKSAASRLGTGGAASPQEEDTDSDSYTESSDYSEYTDDEEEEESPLPPSRPDDPAGAVRYDVIKTSWLPRNPAPTAEKIRQSITELWEVLNTIQKRWRSDSKAVLEAQEAKKTGELPVLKSRVTSQRELLLAALKAALQYAHPNVLWNIGKVKAFLALSYSFLANRLKEKDYDGELSSVIFEVLARSADGLTGELLEETKLIKALNLMKKNANDANKALIQRIVDGAAASNKKSKVSPPPASNTTDIKSTKRPASALTPASAPAGAARPNAEGPVSKKLKTPEPAPSLLKKPNGVAVGPKMASLSDSAPQKRPGEKPSVAPVRARGNQVINKSSGFFSAMNAATKKPAASVPPTNTVKSGTQARSIGVTAVKDKKPAPSASKPAFSFADTMALLTEPKKEVEAAPKPEKQLPPETEEEKVKRLRKESRRHLRVTWKPDASLVAIQYFNHVPEEDEGHEENFVRDAGDIGGEGRMFKQHRDMAEDDEDDEDNEPSYREWTEPKPVDFGNLDPNLPNFAPYGGSKQQPASLEKEANLLRERSVLMVHYAAQSDIPPSPREPAEGPSERTSPAREFGKPPETNKIWKRTPAQPVAAATPDITALLDAVNKIRNQNQAPAQPAMASNTYPTVHQAAPPAAPPAGPLSTGVDLSSILSTLGAGINGQGGFPQPSENVAASTVAAPLPGADLSALLNTMAAANVPPPPIPYPWQYYNQAYQQPPQPPQAAPNAQYSYQNQYNQQPGGGTKRQRDDNNNNERGHDTFKKAKSGKKGNWFGERPHKVLPCKFYQQGKCNKGEDCTYIHDRN